VAEGGAAPADYEAWVTRWRTRLGYEAHTRQAAATLMRAHNPAVIPRNHRVEAVLDAAVHQNDVAPLEAFLAVLATPWAVAPHQEAYSAPPAPSERVSQTFCGTWLWRCPAVRGAAPPPHQGAVPRAACNANTELRCGACLWNAPYLWGLRHGFWALGSRCAITGHFLHALPLR
jgi:hypothetical protein